MARPKEFIPEETLKKAMDVFWRQGYEATSIEDLVTHMGINRGSLYETFGDKRQLYSAALDRYCTQVMSDRLKVLDEPGSACEAIRNFFRRIVNIAGTEAAKKGCLVANSAMELSPHDKEAGKRVTRTLKWVEDRFHQTLRRAKTQGELDHSKNLRAMARTLTCLLQGAAVMAKAGADKHTLQDIVQSGLTILD